MLTTGHFHRPAKDDSFFTAPALKRTAWAGVTQLRDTPVAPAGPARIALEDQHHDGFPASNGFDARPGQASRPDSRRGAPRIATTFEPQHPPLTDVAAFINWENLRFSLWKRKILPNLSLLMEAIQGFGRVVVARAYADWLQDFFLKNLDQTVLYHAVIEPVFVPTWDPEQQRRRKNSVDVKLSSDCLEVCYANPNITRFVLVTGDADFLHVVNSLRRVGREVIVIGVSWSTSPRIVGQVDDLLYYDRDIVESPAPLNPPSAGTPPRREALPGFEGAVEALVGLVKEQRAAGRYPTLAWLGSQMKRAAPGFRHQDHDFPRFKQFVLHVRDRGLLQVATLELTDWAYLPGEPPPETAWRNQDDAPRPTPVALWESEAPLEDFESDFLFLVWSAHQLGSMTADSLADHLQRWANSDQGGDEVVLHGLRGLGRPSFQALVALALRIGLLAPVGPTADGGPDALIALNPCSDFVRDVLAIEACITGGEGASIPR
jgi:uncharacterized protein (TIGR00288 family)